MKSVQTDNVLTTKTIGIVKKVVYRLPTEDPQKDQLDRQTAGVLLSEPLYGLPAAPQQTADCSHRPFFLTQITVGFFPPSSKTVTIPKASAEKRIFSKTPLTSPL